MINKISLILHISYANLRTLESKHSTVISLNFPLKQGYTEYYPHPSVHVVYYPTLLFI